MTETLERPPLTDRQRAIYEHIVDFHRSRGYATTIRELCSHFDIRSPNGVKCHLELMRRKGWITWEPNHARTIRPVEVHDVEQQ
jgi:repressor LexA